MTARTRQHVDAAMEITKWVTLVGLILATFKDCRGQHVLADTQAGIIQTQNDQVQTNHLRSLHNRQIADSLGRRIARLERLQGIHARHEVEPPVDTFTPKPQPGLLRKAWGLLFG